MRGKLVTVGAISLRLSEVSKRFLLSRMFCSTLCTPPPQPTSQPALRDVEHVRRVSTSKPYLSSSVA